MHTEQIDFWTGTFGKEYTDRNTRDQQEWDSLPNVPVQKSICTVCIVCYVL